MPFAPVVYEDDVDAYFECDKLLQLPADYMRMVYPLKKQYHPEIPAVAHADGSGKLQIIKRDNNIETSGIPKNLITIKINKKKRSRKMKNRNKKDNLKLVLINLSLLIAGIILLEIIFNSFEKMPKATVNLDVRFHPYIMWYSDLPHNDNEFYISNYSGKKYSARLDPNNLQFASKYDYEFVPYEKFVKDKNTRVVVMTGGSAVHGHGASSNDHVISGQLEKYLNQYQSKYKYVVINVAMGSWIAFQEFIGLSLYGRQFDPDWIVVMDGVNDINSFCDHSAGVGNPMFWPSMRFYLEGKRIRGAFSRFLAKHSSIYRAVTRTTRNDLDNEDNDESRDISENENWGNLVYNTGSKDPRFRVVINTKWDEIDRQIDFYMYAQESILMHFQNAKFILSNQPKSEGFSYDHHDYISETDKIKKDLFKSRMKSRLNEIYANNKDKNVIYSNLDESLTYFFYSVLFRNEELAEKYQKNKLRDVVYKNPETCYSYNERNQNDLRKRYFNDFVHYNDNGHELLGIFFAGQVIRKDFPEGESKAIVDKLTGEMTKLIERVEGVKRTVEIK